MFLFQQGALSAHHFLISDFNELSFTSLPKREAI